jgi:hypothetical protein|tara:strand:- start:2619 stop:3089 length:471 start_codon:yes stop_codon:yes gene_type:complete
MIYNKFILIIILSLLISCGYKPSNQKNNNLVYLQNIEIIGEQRISYILKNNILLVSNKDSKNRYAAKIEIVKKKKDKVKNKNGKILRYNLALNTDLELTNLQNNTKVIKTFSRDANYEVATIHSDTIKNENNVTKNLIQQISDDIVNFLNILMRNK